VPRHSGKSKRAMALDDEDEVSEKRRSKKHKTVAADHGVRSLQSSINKDIVAEDADGQSMQTTNVSHPNEANLHSNPSSDV
jgi:hypothetical protein